MATKSTKSAGKILGQTKEYWINAAKQFIWPIDFTELQILVPEKDWKLAEDNLMVAHFRAHGWHVQTVISVEYTKPYVAPVSDKPMFKPIEKDVVKLEPEFKFNQVLKIASTGTELKIVSIDKKSIELKYIGIDKPNIFTTPDNLSQSIRRGVWLKM